MYLFSVTEPVDLLAEPTIGTRRGLRLRPVPGVERATGRAIRLEPAPCGRVTTEVVYVGFSRPFLGEFVALTRALDRPVLRLFSDDEKARALSLPGMPVRLGAPSAARGNGDLLEAQLDALPPNGRPRIAIVNPFGYAFGDTVVLLMALRELSARLSERFGAAQLDILQHPDNTDTEALYLESGLIRSVHHLPAPLRLLASYDAYFDLSFGYASHGLAWADEMLEMLGVDPANVPPARKRNWLPIHSRIAKEVRAQTDIADRAEPLVLFHPRASSAIRSIPDRLAADLMQQLLDRTDWTLVSAVPLPFEHPRYIDWSPLSTSFERLACLIAQAHGFLCVDTSIYHVADAVDVPGVALFNSIAPEYRMAYYSRMHGILLGGERNPVFGKPTSDDPADLACAESLWSQLDLDDVIDRLDALMAFTRTGAGV